MHNALLELLAPSEESGRNTVLMWLLPKFKQKFVAFPPYFPLVGIVWDRICLFML